MTKKSALHGFGPYFILGLHFPKLGSVDPQVDTSVLP